MARTRAIDSGISVSSAGDINGDGFDDLIVGAFHADGPGDTRNYAGDSYVVFGHAGAFAAEIDLAAVAAGNGGFVIHGQDANDEPAFRCPRPATSTATASTTSSSGRLGAGPGNTRVDAGDGYVLFGSAHHRRIPSITSPIWAPPGTTS